MPNEADARFVGYITELAQDAGIRAALRSGLGRPVNRSDRMHAYLARWTDSDKPHQEAVRYTVAALIAHNPIEVVSASRSGTGNIGASIARYGALAARTREASVHLLTRQPASQLCRMLTRVIVPLRTADVAVDFVVLLDDASRWPWRRTEIARRWLQAYYRIDAIETDDGIA
ncbi:type I-E CRISPR-associated protein Cse2/CasB [Nocardia sp. NPDC050406]|uniref:type I-E CRISPR-associated protein Cse2/CasB n=1 Tax=Nocardia sp. NPDC050406 TaxID=3364318 RepID=UPI00379F38FB